MSDIKTNKQTNQPRKKNQNQTYILYLFIFIILFMIIFYYCYSKIKIKQNKNIFYIKREKENIDFIYIIKLILMMKSNLHNNSYHHYHHHLVRINLDYYEKQEGRKEQQNHPVSKAGKSNKPETKTEEMLSDDVINGDENNNLDDLISDILQLESACNHLHVIIKVLLFSALLLTFVFTVRLLFQWILMSRNTIEDSAPKILFPISNSNSYNDNDDEINNGTINTTAITATTITNNQY